MSYYWCKACGGEMVSCECPEIDDDYDGPPDYLPEDIDDAQVRWSIGDDGVGRIEVAW